MPMDGGEFSFSGSVLIAEGRVRAVGAHPPLAAGAGPAAIAAALGMSLGAFGPETVIADCAGQYVLPGFIDAHCHVGIGEEIFQYEGDDVNEITDPLTPELRATDGVNPEDEAFRDARRGGVTALFVCPGSANVIGGTGAVLKTAGRTVEEMTVRDPAGLKAALGENPKTVYGEQKKLPSTRMGTAALLRQAFVDAQTYRDKLRQGQKDPDKLPERDLGMEHLLLVLEKKIPLRAHAHRADDIMTAIRVAREFDLDMVIEHCTDGHKIADILAAAGYPAVVGPALINRCKPEVKDKNLRNPGVLAAAGVPVALMTDHGVTPVEQLSLCAALAVKHGMTYAGALKALTLDAARILGVEARLGSLTPGKDADIVVWRGEPLSLPAAPAMVLIGGRDVTDD
ncbi:MAG: amidohydrolase family protein [Gracilibacteraceae bacterium]|jgi:imidazolonepropionase-like amidohydrolase|nr:amidohydrolase family protein [Gracilibacteraceae bacterium]